ncbi:MAG: DNA mismatch repair protein MutH, partial [Prevotella sp.]|nr:DNA mismatch repair protein MutH [Prevotella sp.]
MEGTVYKTKESVLHRAQEIINIPLGDIDTTGRLSTGKGAIGTVIEESWFGYRPNNDANPDFPEAGVELKVTPYFYNKKGEISAKERLVITIINYMTEYLKTFEESDFWHKSETLLIMSYEHLKNVPKTAFTISKAILFSFPEEDLLIIKDDWGKIIAKIKAGEAHLITEGDTMYLVACPKGATSKTLREQPFNTIPAKQRAYSLKQKYMTMILRKYIFGKDESERVIKDWHVLEHKNFEQYIVEKLVLYYGKTQEQLKEIFGINSSAKNINELLLAKMLDVKGKITCTTEFQSACILPKTIRIQKNGHIREDMSFPSFEFIKIIKETWEDSKLRNYLEPTKFLFVIFQENEDGELVFNRVMFWNMPAKDLEEVRRVWERTISIIKEGVKLYSDGRVVKNNLPKKSESPIAHVRPHARNANDTCLLPNGEVMSKQCFWLNNKYIERIIG